MLHPQAESNFPTSTQHGLEPTLASPRRASDVRADEGASQVLAIDDRLVPGFASDTSIKRQVPLMLEYRFAES